MMARDAERDLQHRRETARSAGLLFEQRPQDLDAHRMCQRTRPGKVDARTAAGSHPWPGVPPLPVMAPAARSRVGAARRRAPRAVRADRRRSASPGSSPASSTTCATTRGSASRKRPSSASTVSRPTPRRRRPRRAKRRAPPSRAGRRAAAPRAARAAARRSRARGRRPPRRAPRRSTLDPAVREPRREQLQLLGDLDAFDSEDGDATQLVRAQLERRLGRHPRMRMRTDERDAVEQQLLGAPHQLGDLHERPAGTAGVVGELAHRWGRLGPRPGWGVGAGAQRRPAHPSGSARTLRRGEGCWPVLSGAPATPRPGTDDHGPRRKRPSGEEPCDPKPCA